MALKKMDMFEETVPDERSGTENTQSANFILALGTM